MKPFYTILPPVIYAPTPNKSDRNPDDVRLVVVHDPEGSYPGTIAWILNPRAEVSYHVLLKEDGKHSTQFVPWHKKAWSCMAYNSYSDNISIAGYRGNSWGYFALNRLARVVAFRLHKRNLPAIFHSKPIEFPPPKGFTFHSELGIKGGNHFDPGLTGIKKAFFISAVKFHRKIGGFRKIWGIE